MLHNSAHGLPVAVAGASGYAGGELLRLRRGASRSRRRRGHRARQRRPARRRPAPATCARSPDLVFAETDARGASPVPTSSSSRCRTAPSARAGPAARSRRSGSSTSARTTGCRRRSARALLRRRAPRRPGRTACPSCPDSARAIAAVARVANTGCHAVAAILAAAPLIAAGLAEPDDVVVVSASGTSGAGRAAPPHLLGSEVMGDLTGYKVGRAPPRPRDQAGGGHPQPDHDAGARADAARASSPRSACGPSAR